MAFGSYTGDMAFPYPKVFEGDMKLVNQELQGRTDGGTCIKAAVENQRQQRDAYNEMPVTAGKGFREAESGPDMRYVGDNAFGSSFCM